MWDILLSEVCLYVANIGKCNKTLGIACIFTAHHVETVSYSAVAVRKYPSSRKVYLLCLNHLGRHVVSDAELQVSDDALHAVVGLLACRTQVLLHGSCHWGEDGLGRLSRVHHLTGVLGRRRGLIVLKSFDMSERFLYCHHQSGRRKRNYEQMFSTDKSFNLRDRNLRTTCSYMKEPHKTMLRSHLTPKIKGINK